MIRSFADADTQVLFERERSRRLPGDIQRTGLRKLRALNQAHELRDLTNPGNHLEKHHEGARRGKYSIRINDQWRICFRWHEGDAFEVEIIDYH